MKYTRQRKQRTFLFFLTDLFAALGLLLIVFVLFLAVFFSRNQQQTGQCPTTTSSFVTRVGNKLCLNGHEFRFAGTNLHWLGSLDNSTYPTFAQIDSAFAAANQMHASVTRGMTMGVSVSCAVCIEPSLNHFNEKAFNTIDYSIKIAAAYHMHLIIPLVQNWKGFPHGSIWTFTEWRGISDGNQFFSNPMVIEDYKNYIAHVLNHVNQYTGIAYKDDPTIMVWATGNELSNASNNWTKMIAEYIKNLAPEQLIEDGRDQFGDPEQFQIQAIDLMADHFYPVNLQRMQYNAEEALQYNKVYYIGEWDWCNCDGGPPLTSIVATFQNTPAIAGDTFWQLYPPELSGNDKYSLVYPGQTPDFQQRAQQLTQHAIKMNTVSTTVSAPPTFTPTSAPSLLPTLTSSPTPSSIIGAKFALLIDAGGQGGIGAHGAHWLADIGYIGGQTVHRGPIEIDNTDNPWLYRTERFGMSGYLLTVPNGNFLVQLSFAETYPAITGPGQRVFSVDVQGVTLKHLDIFKETGGRDIALVKSFHVTVTNGNLTITFAKEVQNPEINAIEIQQQ